MSTQPDIKNETLTPQADSTRGDRPTIRANPRLSNIGGWQDRHNEATMAPNWMEKGLVAMIKGWSRHAAAHKHQFESVIGEDYVLGAEWQQIGKGLLGLLNGSTGRLDCGTLDGYIRDTFKLHGYNEEGDLPA